MSRAQLTSTVEQNTGGAVAPFVAGKNFLVNGLHEIWQRGTSGTVSQSATAYVADHWWGTRFGGAAGMTMSQTTGANNLSYGLRAQRTAGNTDTSIIQFGQNIESLHAEPLRGQTVTFSFYVRAGSNFSSSSVTVGLQANTSTDGVYFANGGWGTNFASTTLSSANSNLNTTYTKVTVTGTVPSNAVGVCVVFLYSPASGTAGAADYLDVSACQLEIGSVATLASRAGSTLQGELALCQRYYYRQSGTENASMFLGYGQAYSSSQLYWTTRLPVQMRTTVQALDYYGLQVYLNSSGSGYGISSISINQSSSISPSLFVTCTSGLSTNTMYNIFMAGSSSYLGFSAEL